MSGKTPIIIALVVVVLLVLAIVGIMLGEDDAPVVVTAPVVVPQAKQPKPAPVPVPEPAPISVPVTQPEAVAVEPEQPAFVLPLLDDSDQLIRDGVVSLTRHEGINGWLGAENLIRKFVVVVDNLSQGSIPREPVAVLAPEGNFVAQQITDKVFVMDPASYDRYDLFTNIFVSIDSRRAAEFYDLLNPLFQSAWKELGYPQGKFNDIVFKAVGRLLETPVITDNIRLVRPVVMYEYEDPRLESLSQAQKQLVRMGPKNTRLIQAKLSEMALELRLILSE